MQQLTRRVGHEIAHDLSQQIGLASRVVLEHVKLAMQRFEIVESRSQPERILSPLRFDDDLEQVAHQTRLGLIALSARLAHSLQRRRHQRDRLGNRWLNWLRITLIKTIN